MGLSSDARKTLRTAVLLTGLTASVFGFAAVFGKAWNGSTDPEGATRAVEQLGLKQVTITGKGAAFTCDGYYRTKFSAVNGNNQKVEGMVCQLPKFMGRPPNVMGDPAHVQLK